MAKKLREEEIDEDFIIASMNMTGPSTLTKNRSHRTEQEKANVEEPIADNNYSQASTVPEANTTKEEKENRKRKIKGDYESLFIRQADIAGRQERSIYIRADYYERIDKIVKLYKNPRLSVFSYVDAVLKLHLETYKQEIKEIHDKLYTAPYE